MNLNKKIASSFNQDFITLISLSLFNCEKSNIKSELLKKSDSLFVDKNLSIYAYGRVHLTNSKGFINGHAQVDSSKLKPTFANLNRGFFFKRKNTFIGTFQKVWDLDNNYIQVNLKKDIEKEIQKDKELFGKKIKVDENKFYSGEIGKTEILENFPNEIYIKLKGINTFSADSVLNKSKKF